MAAAMSGPLDAGSTRRAQERFGFRGIGPSDLVDGSGSRVTGGDMISGQQGSKWKALLPTARGSVDGLLFRVATRSRFSIATTAALQQEDLPALRALPGEHSEFRIDAFLEESMAGDARQFDFSAVGTSLFSFTHPFPSETAVNARAGNILAGRAWLCYADEPTGHVAICNYT
jgi:hypothetical protein